MSDDKPGLKANAEIPVIVDQEHFTIELQKYYSGHNENSKKLEWSSERIQSVIKLLDDYKTAKFLGRRPTNQQYHHANKYDSMNVGNQKVLIMKRKNITDPVVQIIPTEEYYKIILEAHIATGHGRRDKMVHALRDKYVVPIFAITIFIKLCKTCLSKKNFAKRRFVVKPLISDDISRRGQVDLVDFETSPDEEYKWLLQYEDHLTRFCFLRPLKSKLAKEVAIEILKIFLEVGCPDILQSDNGREFTASVLEEIVNLWPACKIVHGKSKYPQSQGSMEHSNQDVKNMIRAWMANNKSMSWSIGCYFVQFQKNSSYHSTIARTPYKALFGVDAKLGLSSTCLSKDVISKLETEDVETGFEEIDNNDKQNSEKDQNWKDLDQTKILIANVYHYFEKEYEDLKAIYGDLDLTPLSKFHQRTALATGVSETTVLQILKEEEERNADKRQEPLEKRLEARKRSRQTIEMGKPRTEYMPAYRRKQREEKFKTRKLELKKIARNSGQRREDLRARAANSAPSQPSTCLLPSASKGDSSDDNDRVNEQSSNCHESRMVSVKVEPLEYCNEEPEIYVPAAVKAEPSDVELNEELAQTDPISLDVKTEPSSDVSSAAAARLCPLLGLSLLVPMPTLLYQPHPGSVHDSNYVVRPSRRKARTVSVTVEPPEYYKQHTQGEFSVAAAASDVPLTQQQHQSSLLGDTEIKTEEMEIEIHEEGYS